MLKDIFPKLEKVWFYRTMQAFFRSPCYIALVVALMAASEVLSVELYVYCAYFAFCAIGFFISDDALPAVPLAACGYMTVSAANNPALPATSIFYNEAFRSSFFVIIAGFILLFLVKLAFSLVFLPKKRAPKLTAGFLLLGLSYLVAGVFSGDYSKKSAFFGFVEIASLCFFFFYFYFTVNWQNVKKSYLFTLITFIGLGIVVEILNMYTMERVIRDGIIYRQYMHTGWGIYNNVGCIMAMCLPAPFYFAATRKNGWAYSVLGGFFMLAVILSQSRGAMLFGAVTFCACIIFTLIRSKGVDRVLNLIVYEVFALAVLVAIAFAKDKILDIFHSLTLRDFFDDSSRFTIYENGFRQFREHPLFGVGFYKCEAFRWGNLSEDSFLPPRYHNTYVQLLACGGGFAMLCYLLHRFQTLFVAFLRPTAEKTAAGLIVLALLLTGIVDCHFFNFGPGILYGITLLFLECSDGAREKGQRRKPLKTE